MINIIFLNSSSGSSDGGLSSNDQSWLSHETNVYDQICYDSIRPNLPLKYQDHSPSYHPTDQSSEHYYYRLPTPSCLIPNEILPAKISQQNDSKKELHKELIHRQKM